MEYLYTGAKHKAIRINMIKYIKNLFKKEPQPNTAIHPDTKRLIEKVVTIKKGKFKGRTLYWYKNLIDMQHNRYNACTRSSTEFNMRIDAETSKEIDEQILEELNREKIRRTAITNLVQNRLERTKMLISIKASYRLASCMYFWIDENLDDYDFEIGDEKIQVFKEVGLESFFLSKPMNNFLPQISLSVGDLRAYSQIEKELDNLLSRQLKEPKEKNTKVT